MAALHVWVRNINGMEVAAAGDSLVYFLDDEQSDDLSAVVSDGEGDFDGVLDDFGAMNFPVQRLVWIANVAQALLRSPDDRSLRYELASSLAAAGYEDLSPRFGVFADGEAQA